MAHVKHWTGESDAAFIHKLSFDFIAQLEMRMEECGITQAQLAKKLNVSEGAVSKLLNNPQNLTLKTVAKYARALGIKAALIAYNDDDPNNDKGLVSAEIFANCWTSAGKPRDRWSVNNVVTKTIEKTTLFFFVSPRAASTGSREWSTSSRYSVPANMPQVFAMGTASNGQDLAEAASHG